MIKTKPKKTMFQQRMLRYDSKYQDYLEAWLGQGYKLTTYRCPHCDEIIDIAKPEKKHCSVKGFWDSMHECPLCNKFSFIKTYPSGKTQSIILKIHS